MLINGVEQTIGLAQKTLEAFNDDIDTLYVSTLGITDMEKNELRSYITSQDKSAEFSIDPVVQFLISATNGILYKDNIKQLKRYPVPKLRLPDSVNHQHFLDIGCSWGRWCLAAAQKGYLPIGIDPSLGGVLAGKRIAKI